MSFAAPHDAATKEARRIHVRGVVQGVGFRPFVYRLAQRHCISGWVLNGEQGVAIHAEGDSGDLDSFVKAIAGEAPVAARISSLEASQTSVEGFADFRIRESERRDRPTARISPDLPVCADCLRELFDPSDRRSGYPYINCTNCGPRYSIVLRLPYDRPNTTMRSWPLCASCASEYADPSDRRFHAQPVACVACGPLYVLRSSGPEVRGERALQRTAELLCDGAIVAIKGLGGYHLACDAARADAVASLRTRKYRKERPFAVMARDLDSAREVIEVTPEVETLLTSVHRPIVLAPAKRVLAGVAPENRDLGVMLPYTPVQHLLFDRGAPPLLVMTSANRSSEPIAYEDDDARERLAGIADALLAGERPIARRVDDSVVRIGPNGPVVLRHARGYAPSVVSRLPTRRPILALGADLKNAIVLVVDGQAFASQHIGDLNDYAVFESFKSTIADLCAMYEVAGCDLVVAHDAHPQYASTNYALALDGEHVAIQHHRAHVASVLAEREAFDERVVGLGFDGTGYGDDGTIWGGEIFLGSLREGLTRVMSLRPAPLPGGDAAARHPVIAAAGFLSRLEDLPDLTAPPFEFPRQYVHASRLIARNVRTFVTTSIGRLFDAVAALLGFTREMTFEGQAAMWLEHLAWGAKDCAPYEMPIDRATLDFRPLLTAAIADRLRRRDASEIAFAFHAALAGACVRACDEIAPGSVVVASGGVFQNELLTQMLALRLGPRLWLNARVPPNDGGIALGQAALAAVRTAVR
jgi:hydrogenase maturation protein HypF